MPRNGENNWDLNRKFSLGDPGEGGVARLPRRKLEALFHDTLRNGVGEKLTMCCL